MWIELIPIRDSDTSLVEAWIGKDYIKKWYGDAEDWMREIRNRNGQFTFIKHYIAKLGKKPIGFCQYYTCADIYEEEYSKYPADGTYSIDYLIGDEEVLGKGYGKEIIKNLIGLIFSLPDSKVIVVQPDKSNAQSCKVLSANGFIYNENNGVYELTRPK